MKKKATEGLTTETPPSSEMDARARIITDGAFDPSTYEIDSAYKDPTTVQECLTVKDLVQFSEKGLVEIDARVLQLSQDGLTVKQLTTAQFREALKKPVDVTKFREAAHSKVKPKTIGEKFREKRGKKERFKEAIDSFLFDGEDSGSGNVGHDFIPLLGGPFNKQLYYADYLKMHSVAYHAFHHDPVAKRIVNMIRQFVLGRGFRVDVNGDDKEMGTGLWRAFEKVNKLQSLMGMACTESSVYGELMLWELPEGKTAIEYDVDPGQEVPTALIPRYRLIDPSVIWDIITYPEDPERVLAYVWVAPTQYQMYTQTDKGERVPSSKFIYQQIPQEQVMHYKVNAVSNEKRGRSDLFPVLGYLKRLRDSVNYAIIADQKNAAWAIDTEIQGSRSDVDQYVKSQQELGTIPEAGSEFVHTAKVKRTYLGNQGSARGLSQSFEWCLNMIAMGCGIPTSYFGTHLSGGQTRASALVGTEPVAKMLEDRQQFLKQIITDMAERLFDRFGLDCSVEVTFPEIITQDRSAKIKDLMIAQTQGWISKERAAEISAKEFGLTDYEYEEEQRVVAKEPPAPAPLTAGAAAPFQPPGSVQPGENTSAVTGQERSDLKQSKGF
jgi:hypothetical protein